MGFGDASCEATILYHKGGSMYSMASGGIGGKKDMEHIDGKALAGSEAYHAYYGYKQEDADFIHALLTGEAPLCTIDDACKSMELVEMLMRNRI